MVSSTLKANQDCLYEETCREGYEIEQEEFQNGYIETEVGSEEDSQRELDDKILMENFEDDKI